MSETTKLEDYYKTLDLKTLKAVHEMFSLFSDMSTTCLGYSALCRMIEAHGETIEISDTAEKKKQHASIIKQLLFKAQEWDSLEKEITEIYKQPEEDADIIDVGEAAARAFGFF